ncbi:MAG: oligosaccharide flippase family protein [Chloroflexota bacterium]
MTVEPQQTMELQEQPITAPRLLTLPGQILRRLPGQEGAFWVLFALATPKLFGPIFTIGLRRFLGPGVAGVFDLATAPYKLLDNFRNFGTGPALVYEREVSKSAANTAWTLNMLFAVIVTLAAQLLAKPIADFYGHPEIEGVFRLLSIAYVFASIGSVHFYLLLRDLDFRARSIPPLGQVIAAGDIAVLFAVWGFGTGALVARELVSVIVGAILLWAVYPFRPHLQLVPELAWRLFKYGAWIGAGLTILFLSQNIDIFVGGRVIRNKSDIGFYTTSWKLAFIAASIFTLVASSMVFPTLSRLRSDIAALRTKLLKGIQQLGLVMFPAAALLAVCAPVVVVPLLGEKWTHYRDSFLVLSLLAIYAGNRTMLSIFFEGYKAIGKPWLVWAYNSVKLAIMIPAMIYGAHHGILGLALTYIPVQILEFPAALFLARRVLGVSLGSVWKAASVPLMTTAVMAVAVIAVELFCLKALHLGDTFSLLFCVGTGLLVYVLALLLLNRQIISEARGVLIKGL